MKKFQTNLIHKKKSPKNFNHPNYEIFKNNPNISFENPKIGYLRERALGRLKFFCCGSVSCGKFGWNPVEFCTCT